MKKVEPKKEKYMTSGGKEAAEKPSYPTIRVPLEHLPDAKKCELGDMCHVGIMGKVVSLSQSRFDKSVEFEMHEVGMEMGKKGEKGEHET